MYTRRRGKISFSDGERAFIFQDENLDPNSELIFDSFPRREVRENVFVPYLTSLHVLLQVAAGLIIMKLVPAYYKSSSKGKKPGSSVNIFWANVFFAVILAVLFVCLDLFLIVSVYSGVDDAIGAITSNNRSALETVFAFGMLGALVSFTLVVLQFIVAAGTKKETQLYVPGVIRLLCCFFHCRCPCKKANGEFWHKVLQTFSIWFLMVFLQLVAGSLIPYLVLAIVNPVPSVTFLALGASTLFCLIVFVASILHAGSQDKRWSVFEKVIAILRGLVFIVFLGLVAITVIIYQGVIQSGTNTGVVSGIILSLVPSGIIAVLGLAVKTKLLRDEDDEEEEGKNESFFKQTATKIRDKISKEGKTRNDKESNGDVSIHKHIKNDVELTNFEYVDEDEKTVSSNEIENGCNTNAKEDKSADVEPKENLTVKEGPGEASLVPSSGDDDLGAATDDTNKSEKPLTTGEMKSTKVHINETAEECVKIDFNYLDDDTDT